MLDIQKFMAQYDNVVKWNLVARNGVHDYSADSIKRQTEYTGSEIQETIKGLEEQDHVEVLDGVADIFVTMMYKHFLVARGVVFPEEIAYVINFMAQEGLMTFKDDHELARNHLIQVTRIVDQENDADSNYFNSASLGALIELMNLVEEYYEVDILDVVEHVMDSNWSKYSPVESSVDVAFEENYIAEKNPKFKDIKGTLNEEHQVVVFRSDNGIGKILKPSTFWNADCGRFL